MDAKTEAISGLSAFDLDALAFAFNVWLTFTAVQLNTFALVINSLLSFVECP